MGPKEWRFDAELINMHVTSTKTTAASFPISRRTEHTGYTVHGRIPHGHNTVIASATKPDAYLRMGYYHNNCFCGTRPADYRRGSRNRLLGHGGHSPLLYPVARRLSSVRAYFFSAEKAIIIKIVNI